ncbi:MAG: esterase/lipase family protein [Pseudomonadota bacterium]
MVTARSGNVRPFRTAALILALASLLAGCPPTPPPPSIDNREEPAWVVRTDPPRGTAVVFIHGLFGTTTGTWTHENGATFFGLLAEDPDFRDKVDIFAFGFTSNMFAGGSLGVVEAANALDQTLIRKRVWDYDQVVLVGHSMGGLIAMRTLIKHSKYRRKVPLLVLYSSPQEGAQIATLGKQFANNKALRQLLPADENDFLEVLDDDWSNLPEQERPAVVCAYETKGVGGAIMIVKRSSATRYCGSERIAVGDADHLSIVKPRDREQMSYVVLANALEKYALGRPIAPLLEMQNFVAEGDRFVYTLGDPLAEGVAYLRNNGSRPLRFTIVPPANPKLLILPAETPKEIPVGAAQDLRFNLLARGRSDPEYEFTLKTPSAPDRRIAVRVPDYDKLEIRYAAQALMIGQAVDGYLAVPANLAALQALPLEEQHARIATVARDALGKRSPGLSRSASWIIAADALSGVGWPDIAGAALLEAKEESPGVVRLPSFQTLSTIVTMESGQKLMQALPQPERPIPAEELAAFKARPAYLQNEDVTVWQRLSTRMRTIPGLRQEGMTLQGDLLQERGDMQAAEAMYLEANRVEESPASQRKIRAVRATENVAVEREPSR